MRNLFKIDEHFECPFFIGTVEDNVDPTFNYRVKVRIDHLHPESVVTENLPWAARVDTAFMGVGDDQALNHAIPEVGTQVLLLPVGHNINSLVYLGSLYKKTAQTPQNESYTDSFGIYMRDGQFIGIEKIQKLFQMLFDGDINIDKVQNATIKIANNISVECKTVNVKVAEVVNVECNTANVKAAESSTVECKSATVKASDSVTLDTPNTSCTGKLNVSGTIDAGGNITSKAEVSANGGSVNLSTHTHTYNPGPGGPTPTTPGQG